MEVKSKVAVITGAARGLGLALSKVCLERGMKVVMADVAVTELCDQVELLSPGHEGAALGVVCDVTNPDNVKHLVKQTFEHFGQVDWLFNNAGISGHLAPVWDLPMAHLQKVLDVNLLGAIQCIQGFLPLMFKQSWRSQIINIASLYSLCSGSMMSAYSMSKHAMLALSESLHFDLRRLNKPVDVAVVCPSFISTDLMQNSMPLHDQRLHQSISALLKRGREAGEVAEMIIQGIERKSFYILPDAEVKSYLEDRAKAICEGKQPDCHNLEQIMIALTARLSREDQQILS